MNSAVASLVAPETQIVSSSVSPQPVAIQAQGLHKAYQRGAVRVPVLEDAALDVAVGECCAIIGSSGSGKSTLLHLLATLDQPDHGTVCYAGERIDNLNRARRDRIRNRHFGMVFQFYHLLPELSALENVLLPAMIGRGVMAYFSGKRELRARAEHLLETVGLAHRLSHRPREMSGGEIQRAAIARALMSDPDVLFADEPTGNLDRKTGEEIIQLLLSLNAERQLTIIMVTHDQSIARRATSALSLSDGKLQPV